MDENDVRQIVERETAPGCLGAILVVIGFSFALTCLIRLDRLEKAAGLPRWFPFEKQQQEK